MQTISDSNGCRQGVIAISVGTIAGFPSVHIHLSEKLKVSFVSHFSLHWIVSTNAFFGKMFFWRLVETKRFGVLIHPRGPLSSDCATHPLWSRIQVWLLELQILAFFPQWSTIRKVHVEKPGYWSTLAHVLCPGNTTRGLTLPSGNRRIGGGCHCSSLFW